jgi:hypothetical protein
MHSLPLFAFFSSPLLLWGLGLAGLPILIHLLNKRKYRETQWAAMRFLLEAVRKNSRRIRIEQLILLAIRTLILILLVCALAQPTLKQLGPYFAADEPVHKIIVLDTSFSMGYEPAGKSRFEQARDIARQIVAESRQGDAFNLLRIAGSDPRVIVAKPAFQGAEVVDEIDQLRFPDERGELHATLDDVVKLLRAAPEVPTKEVFVISDFQRMSWTPDSAGKPAEIRNALRKIADSARLVLIDLGEPGSQNNAVTDFRPSDSFIAAGRPTSFKASVATYGPHAVGSRTLEFLVDGKVQEQRKLDLEPSAEQVAQFTMTFPTGGEHRVEVRLENDSLNVDNRRVLSVPVKDEIRVLCVNGRLAGRAQDTATYHLELALAPKTRDKPSESLIRPKVIKYGELRGVDLADYDCVFLCDVSAFDANEAKLLESYLKAGGGVIWCLGDKVEADRYNQQLYRDGQGILPAKLGERQGDKNVDRAFVFDARDLSHPIVNIFQGNTGVGLESTLTFQYDAVTPAPSRAHTVLKFENGDPAIVEMPVGAGRAILVTTSVDETWGTWALWPSFVPMVQEMVIYAISGQVGERQLRVDEPLLETLQTRGADVSGSVSRPDGQVEAVQLAEGGGVTQFSYEKTDVAGFYEVEFGPPVSQHSSFAVNVDPRESNLAKLEKTELDRELLSGSQFTYRTDWQEMERQATGRTSERGGGLTRLLLYAVLGLLFLEQLLAWNFNFIGELIRMARR